MSAIEPPGSPTGQRSPEAVVDGEQHERFKDAFERSARGSEAASRATHHGAPSSEFGGVQGDQESLGARARPQDTFSPREQITGHGKVTVDKWSQ